MKYWTSLNLKFGIDVFEVLVKSVMNPYKRKVSFIYLKIDGVTGKSWSFEQLEMESNRLANNLYDLGLRPKHVACLYGTNRPEYAHIITGVAMNNAALTIANSQLTPGNDTLNIRTP